MTNVKVTLKGKNGKVFEALVPISTACKVLFQGEDTSNISRMSYSVARKLNDYVLSRATAEERVKLEDDAKVFLALLERSNNFLMSNGVMLYRD